MKNNEKVLVMGGNGFIGKNIVDYFQKRCIETDVYDLFLSNIGVKSYQGNILTDDNLEEIIKGYDTIIYLITSVSPKKSMDFPESSYTQDIPMLLRTLECCKKYNVKRIIFASSGGTVYGEGNGKNITEDVTEQPINNYAICKLACEKILQLYNKLYGMENMILRISNPYGIGQNPLSGVGVITTFATKMLNDEEIVLFGDGSISRDFIHIEAVCDAFYKASLWEFDNNIVPVFNIGSGQSITLNQVIDILSETLEITPTINYLEERGFDVKHNVLDIEKAKKYLGYSPGNDEIPYIKEYVKTLKKQSIMRR